MYLLITFSLYILLRYMQMKLTTERRSQLNLMLELRLPPRYKWGLPYSGILRSVQCVKQTKKISS